MISIVPIEKSDNEIYFRCTSDRCYRIKFCGTGITFDSSD